MSRRGKGKKTALAGHQSGRATPPTIAAGPQLTGVLATSRTLEEKTAIFFNKLDQAAETPYPPEQMAAEATDIAAAIYELQQGLVGTQPPLSALPVVQAADDSPDTKEAIAG
eukprot:gene23296-3601_t